MRQPAHGLRHPLIFYYGHPAALYVNKLRAAGILKVCGLPIKCITNALSVEGEATLL